MKSQGTIEKYGIENKLRLLNKVENGIIKIQLSILCLFLLRG